MTVDLASILSRYSTARSLQELMACARDYEGAGAPRSPSWPKVRLALTGNYSTQFLAKGFPLALAARKLAADFYESPYNQWRAELLDTGSPLYAFGPTHILLALTSTEFAFGSLRNAETAIKAVAEAVESALRSTTAHIFVTLPEPLADELSDSSAAYAWRIKVGAGLRAALGAPRVTLIDLEPLIRSFGAQVWFDDRFYDTSKLPYHPNRTPDVLGLLADAIVGAIVPRCKLVVVDLDDTLWGGRVGDDGWDGIDLDPAGKGRHFLRLQAFLSGLHAKGIMLAIASKNNLESVTEVFARRSEMMLRFEDFVAAEVHWEPKSASIGRILDRLKLSTTGIVFLDDNPVERAEVRGRFPDIEVPELPDDPAHRVPMLIRTGLFDHRVTTSESRGRNRMYVENAARDSALRDAGNYDDFLRDLRMEMEVYTLDKTRERVIELVQKTNQFNLTTRRHDWAALAAMMRKGFGHSYRLKDKFGDNGVISVVTVVRDAGDDARIDLWLMSCRVLGRKVEEAILADIAARARRAGAQRLIGEYIPSSKNALVKDLYPRLGFTEIDRREGTVRYEFCLDESNAGSDGGFIDVVDCTLPADHLPQS